jgi:tetratricopeptide (TPR) repeat protein
VLCAEGDFGRALAIALPLFRSCDDPVVKTRAAVTAGSALRQLRRYDEARSIETAALRAAPARERAHVLIGLAADAVGVGDARTCARRLSEAARALPARDWRARVRLDWVRCERALLTGDAVAAVAFARSALRRSLRAGAVRHEAKSLLFLGVSLRTAARGDEGRRALRKAEQRARSCGATHLARVARDNAATREDRVRPG